MTKKKKNTAALVAAAAVLLTAVGTALFWAQRKGQDPGYGFQTVRAFMDMGAMVRQGNRYYGAPGRDEALSALVKRFESVATPALYQRFDYAHPDGKGIIKMANVLIRQRPEKSRRIILASHWDTRLWAEEDKDPANQQKPIVGANDGTSGIAVMAEIARALAERPLANLGVDYILFDGEEYGRPGNNLYCQGSHYLANNLSQWYPGTKPLGAIVMDMVADADLGIPKETFSMRASPALINLIWDVAYERGEKGFDQRRTISIIDDHVPLTQAGIPSVLLIDYDYPWWHTLGDTMDKCSAESLARTGTVVLASLRKLDEKRD